MTEEWEGFSDEDLRRMKGGGTPNRGRGRPPGNRASRSRGGSSTVAAKKTDTSRVPGVQLEVKTDVSEQLPTWDEQTPDGDTIVEGLVGTASKPVAVVSASNVVVSTPSGDTDGASTKFRTEENSSTGRVASVGLPSNSNRAEQKSEQDVIELSDDPSVQQAKLQELQRQQKEIEEQNKQKKAALQKTIQERFQRSKRETAVLKKVKSELSKLDDAISSDVSILRDTIDQASRDLTAAKNRYDAAEVEFVAAKIGLFKKTERKEMLTQHLCTIIQESELRKAKRLEELTIDLAMEGMDSRLEATDTDGDHRVSEPSTVRSDQSMEQRDKPSSGSCQTNL